MEPQTDEDEPYGASSVVKSRIQKVDPDKDRTVFVGGLPKVEAGPDVPAMEQQLAEIFEEYGISTYLILSSLFQLIDHLPFNFFPFSIYVMYQRRGVCQSDSQEGLCVR